MSETKEQMIRRLKKKYDVSLPWELDDALYYAQLSFPDTTAEELLN